MATIRPSYREQVAGMTPAQRAELLARLTPASRARSRPTAIPRRLRDRAAPLSPAQRGIWFAHSLDPTCAAFNMSIRLHLRGALDVAALSAALAAIVGRHEVLRTTYPVTDDLPEQVIGPAAPLGITHTDVSELESAMRAGRLEDLWAAEAVKPFDLACDRPLRAHLVKLGSDEHVLLLTTHHIACDGWSIAVFARELDVCYRAHARGQPPALPPLPLQYGDYAAWSSARVAEGHADESLAYWRDELRGPVPETLQLGQRPRTPGASRAASEVSFAFQPGGSARPASTWSFAWVLAGFQALIHAASGQSSFVLGTDVSGRGRLELEPLIGCFVNQVVLRADLSGDPSFAEIVRRAQRALDEAIAHKDVPFEQLVQALNPRRRARASPLFQAKIVGNPWFGTSKPPEWRLDGLLVETMLAYPPATQLDLTLFIHNGPSGVSGTLEYATDIFDPPVIAGLLGDFKTILNEAASNPDVRLSALRASVASARGCMTPQTTAPARPLGTLKALTPKPIEPPAARDHRESFPYGDGLMVIEADGQAGLRDWVAAHVPRLEAELKTRGAILFRGIPLRSPADLESFARLFCQDLFSENGEHPREAEGGAVYSPVFYPPEEKLLWHNENSFNLTWPMKIWFGCVRPAERGGETPIADSRRLFERLDPRLRRPFVEKGVMYVRNYRSGVGLDWRRVFQTDSRAAVERRCREEAIDFEWRPDGALRTRSVRPAVAKHPDTGAMTWFNQAQHWHPSCLDPATRESLLELFGEDDLPRHCHYGDGSPIDAGVMSEILAAYRDLEVVFPWRESDVLMVDNLAVAHARNPFRGERKLLVAMGQMTSWSQLS